MSRSSRLAGCFQKGLLHAILAKHLPSKAGRPACARVQQPSRPQGQPSQASVVCRKMHQQLREDPVTRVAWRMTARRSAPAFSSSASLSLSSLPSLHQKVKSTGHHLQLIFPLLRVTSAAESEGKEGRASGFLVVTLRTHALAFAHQREEFSCQEN